VGEITVSVVESKNPNWFDTHQIPKNAAYAIPDEAATRLMTASLDVTDPTAATRVVSDAVDHFGRIDVLVNNAGYGLITAFEEMSPEQIQPAIRNQRIRRDERHSRRVASHATPAQRALVHDRFDGWLPRWIARDSVRRFQVCGGRLHRVARPRTRGVRHHRDNCRTRILPHRFSRQVLGDSRTGDAHRGLSRVKCAFRAATETANHAQ
jgi:hypothetical protein